MSRVKGGKFLRIVGGKRDTMESWTRQVWGLLRGTILHSLIAGVWGRCVLPRPDGLKVERWWLLTGWIVWEAEGWVESKGCANSRRRQDECRRRDIALFSLFIGGCIDKTHRRSHALLLNSQHQHRQYPNPRNCQPALKCDLFKSRVLPTIGWIGRWAQRLFVSAHQISRLLLLCCTNQKFKSTLDAGFIYPIYKG